MVVSGVDGSADEVDEVWTFHYKDLHRCKIKIAELVPGKKAGWLVLDNYFNFTKDKNERKGTIISFEISKKGDKTEICFTH